MDSRYYRPSSPRGRMLAPGRSSTGTFADPYDSYYSRGNTSPRTSGERIAGGNLTYAYPPAPSSSSSGTRSGSLKYDSYSGRPRRNTLTEEDRAKPLPIRTSLQPHSHHHHHERPSSPLARSWDNRGDTYITQGNPTRHEHKRIYSVDDKNLSTKLVAEKDVVEPRRRDSQDNRGYTVTSGSRSYHPTKSSSHTKSYDVGDESYSYTDAAGMYRDTEPAWRRPRAGSLERGSRPTSLIMDKAPRSSARELGPPPSTRGFDKINNGIGRNSSLREPTRDSARSSSIDAPRDPAPKYEPYADAIPHRSSSQRHHATTVHQEPREHRRDTYHDEYDRRDRDFENRRQNTADRFEDREVVTRGFGIAPGNPALMHEQHALDREPIWSAQETGRGRVDDYGATPYYPSERVEPRMPMPEPPRAPRERDVQAYEERPRERERERRDRPDRDAADRSHLPPAVPALAGAAAAGAAVTYGAGDVLKAREKERERDRDRDRERDRERDRDVGKEREREHDRERRKDYDDRDRRDRAFDDRRERDRVPEERRDRPLDDRRERERGSEDRRERAPVIAPAAATAAIASAAYASTQDPDKRPRDRRYEDEGRERRSRKGGSSDGSGDERPRHYVDREVARDADRRKDLSAKEPVLDADEEYRRRIQQEMDRSGRSARDSDSDKERERRRRKEERRDRSRDVRDDSDDARSRGPPMEIMEPPRSYYDDRAGPMINTGLVSEPDTINSALEREERDGPSKSVQIVAPPKDPTPAPKGILRKPTEKFPEHHESIREGVAPHKDAMKGKDIPPNARWTKIDRSLVNPEALEEAKERYEERMDCVIVLRVLTKQDIQKLADRTKEIRQSREDDSDRPERPERHERRDRDKERRHRSHRDDDDRNRRYEYSDSEDDVGRDRDPDWYRKRHEEPLRIEAGR